MTRGQSGAAEREPPLRRRPWEALAPAVVLVLRCFLPIATPLYLDWIVVFCIYWIAFVFFSESRSMDRITAAAALAMLALYLCRTIPTLMETLRLCL